MRTLLFGGNKGRPEGRSHPCLWGGHGRGEGQAIKMEQVAGCLRGGGGQIETPAKDSCHDGTAQARRSGRPKPHLILSLCKRFRLIEGVLRILQQIRMRCRLLPLRLQHRNCGLQLRHLLAQSKLLSPQQLLLLRKHVPKSCLMAVGPNEHKQTLSLFQTSFLFRPTCTMRRPLVLRRSR